MEAAGTSKTWISNTPQSVTFQSTAAHIYSMPRERQASSTELYWYYTGMIYGRSGLTTSCCLKGCFEIYDIVGGTNQLTRFIFLYSGQMKTLAPNNKEKRMFNDTIKIMFIWKTVYHSDWKLLWPLASPGLVAFAVFRNVTVGFVMSVCTSVRLNVTNLGSHWTGFHGILDLVCFRKSVDEIQFSLKSEKNNGHFTWGPCRFMISRWILLIMRNVVTRKLETIVTIIIINIQGWAIWPVPSPDLQLLSPSFLWSPNCSLSLWAVMV
jgi:hypothetical protein